MARTGAWHGRPRGVTVALRREISRREPAFLCQSASANGSSSRVWERHDVCDTFCLGAGSPFEWTGPAPHSGGRGSPRHRRCRYRAALGRQHSHPDIGARRRARGRDLVAGAVVVRAAADTLCDTRPSYDKSMVLLMAHAVDGVVFVSRCGVGPASGFRGGRMGDTSRGSAAVSRRRARGGAAE